MVSRSKSSHEKSNMTTNIFWLMFLEYGMGWWSLSARAGLGECVHWKLRPCVLGHVGPFFVAKGKVSKKGRQKSHQEPGLLFHSQVTIGKKRTDILHYFARRRSWMRMCGTILHIWFKWLMNSMDVDQLIGAWIWDGNGDGIDRMAMKNVEIFHVLGLMGDGWNL